MSVHNLQVDSMGRYAQVYEFQDENRHDQGDGVQISESAGGAKVVKQFLDEGYIILMICDCEYNGPASHRGMVSYVLERRGIQVEQLDKNDGDSMIKRFVQADII